MTLLLVVLGIVAVLVVLTAIGMVRARGNKNSTFLQWDPVERAEWRREVDEADVHAMLALTNERRVERGEEPLTMAEYEEQMRRP